jgi:gamma-glutamyltranspeptidase/glutathione hydrolase
MTIMASSSRQNVTRSGASGRGGAVAAARAESAQAGIAMLEAGGNAIDAAIAAAFVAGVVEPMETTLAGTGFLLLNLPEGGGSFAVEFGPRAPAKAHAQMFEIDQSRALDRGLGVSVVVGDANIQGILAAGVPSTILALIEAQARFGKLPLARVMAPAIRAAHDGFEADSYFALSALASLPALRKDPGTRKTFLVNGDPPVAAHSGTASYGPHPRIRQEALGRSLEIIAAKGAAAFQSGEIAKDLIATVRDLGGILSAEDLRAVSPQITQPRRLSFRGFDIWAPMAPSGGLTELQMLTIWQALHPETPPLEDDARRLRGLAEVSWHAFADRYHWLGDPDFVAVPETGLLSKDYAAAIAATIRKGEAPPRLGPDDGLPWEVFASRAVHDPWRYEGGGKKAPAWRPEGSTEPKAGTTHVSAMDGQGMAVTITHTAANMFGNQVVCERTGFLFDATMGWFNARPGAANSIAGGKRPLANMGPLLITRGGKSVAAIGAPGGRRIVNAMVQVALDITERGMDAAAAVQAPRIDASGSTLLASERLAAVAKELEPACGTAALVPEQHQGFGYELARPVVVVRNGAGEISAATDPFVNGHAMSL